MDKCEMHYSTPSVDWLHKECMCEGRYEELQGTIR